MKNTNNFQEMLREQLHLLFPDFKESSNKKEVMINCPMCLEEGRKDSNYHMYISLGYDNKPPMYNCFKNSNHRGILTKSFLERYTQYSQYLNTDLLSELSKHNSRMSDLGRYRANKLGNYNFETNLSKNDKLSILKLSYINKRLGVNLTLEDIQRMKIILNINEFISSNGIKSITRSQYTMNLLNEYFLGFLTNNNSTIILRNLVKDRDKLPEIVHDRYIKYSIINNNQFTGYYIIPTQCDIYKQINIHIAEGTFDILSIFCNLRNMNTIQNIYASIGGNSYLSLIKYFLIECGIINPIFHIYIDNDIPRSFIDKISNSLKPLGIRVFIHFNSFKNEKDFGVDKDHITEVYYEL